MIVMATCSKQPDAHLTDFLHLTHYRNCYWRIYVKYHTGNSVSSHDFYLGSAKFSQQGCAARLLDLLNQVNSPLLFLPF